MGHRRWATVVRNSVQGAVQGLVATRVHSMQELLQEEVRGPELLRRPGSADGAARLTLRQNVLYG